MLYTLLIIIHVIICFLLATVVLLQSSKGGGLAGAFGGAGGAPQQLLGSRGMTTLLHKITIYCAVGFFLTSFMLFMFQGGDTRRARNIVGEAAREGNLAVPVQGDVEGLPPLEIPAQTPTAEEDQTAEPESDAGGG